MKKKRISQFLAVATALTAIWMIKCPKFVREGENTLHNAVYHSEQGTVSHWTKGYLHAELDMKYFVAGCFIIYTGCLAGYLFTEEG